MSAELFIWVNKWEERQSFQEKRGKPWAPPWIKLYPHLLDDPEFLDLSAETRSLLVGIWMLFGRSHGTVTKDTRRLSKQLHQRVTEAQLTTLNHAGFLSFCSGTVLEQRRAAFWNRSVLEEKREEETKPSVSPSTSTSTNGRTEGDSENAVPFDVPDQPSSEADFAALPILDLDDVLKSL